MIFEQWLRNAEIGQKFVYHVGPTTWVKAIHMAGPAEAAKAGKVFLCQRRHSGTLFSYEYIAVRVSPLTAQLVEACQ